MARILLVDDDPQSLDSTRKMLELAGHVVTTAVDGQFALELIRPSTSRQEGSSFDVVVTDVRMPRLGGIEFLRALSLCGEQTPVILMTAFGRVEDAVWAMKLGAVDFITKPFKRHSLLASIDAAMKRVRPRTDKDGVYAEDAGMLIGSSEATRSLRAMIAQVAPTAASVLITGESGTGKELVARRIHSLSQRAKGRFIALNCAAVPENLIESELFGFEKGAFTGATGVKEGLFEAADGGTLLLDEIGDMPVSLQSKLLRTLQDGEVRRLGATMSKKVDVRVIAATHRDLKELARAGTFRQDLIYRLEVIGIHVPPLRERNGDIPGLAAHFFATACTRHDKSIGGISNSAMARLLLHSWPGNVRELSNVIERAVVLAVGDEIRECDLPPHIASITSVDGVSGVLPRNTISVPIGTPLEEVKELLIRRTLEATSGDKNMTARLLGINSRTIYRKLDKSEKDRDAEQ